MDMFIELISASLFLVFITVTLMHCISIVTDKDEKK